VRSAFTCASEHRRARSRPKRVAKIDVGPRQGRDIDSSGKAVVREQIQRGFVVARLTVTGHDLIESRRESASALGRALEESYARTHRVPPRRDYRLSDRGDPIGAGVDLCAIALDTKFLSRT
jgi:hypothetical protein